MFRKIVSSATVAAAFALVALPAGAQRISRNPPGETTLSVSPYAGYMAFGDMINGPLNTSLKSVAAPVYGVDAVQRWVDA